ncbi:hypothetical protein KUCAC02_031982, partial [Chaenocephalus aceratus]
VYRSSRTLASIPSASVSHSGKDLRLAKMAAVVCALLLHSLDAVRHHFSDLCTHSQ